VIANVEAVLRDLAERRVDADIEARDVAAPPIIRFLSRPPTSWRFASATPMGPALRFSGWSTEEWLFSTNDKGSQLDNWLGKPSCIA
jgi:hypothetical protein